MRQGSFNFNDNDDEQPSFERRPDFFNKPVKAKPKEAESNNKPAATPPTVQNPVKKEVKKPTILSVTGLNRSIKFALADTFPGKIMVEGEISNYKHHGSGHLYLSLKDENSTVAAVMWRTTAGRLKFVPENGMAVVATGRLEVYEPQGKYQLILEKLEPSGVGALELAFRQLAEKLEKEGLFDKSKKKPLPPYPMTIAIVTSQTGAAVKDICQTLGRRWRFARKLLYPVTVQGTGSAMEIAAAIKDINARLDELQVDVMIVGRGGGSLEDLWPFNEEPVARAIAGSKIPIISGVGHEIDTTIADMVADVRAATPTAAAELAVPVADELLMDLAEYSRVLNYDLKEMVRSCRESLEMVIGRPFFAQPMSMLNYPRQQLDELEMRLGHQMASQINRNRQMLEKCHEALRKIEPHGRIGKMKLELEEVHHRAYRSLKNKINRENAGLANMEIRLERRSPSNQVAMGQNQFEMVRSRLDAALIGQIREEKNSLEQLKKLLNNLDHKQVLKRGYTVTRVTGSDKIVNNAADLSAGDRLKTEFADGVVESEVI